MKKLLTRQMMQFAVLGMVLLQSGCASFIANNTSQTVGTKQGERSLSQVVGDNAIERTAKINLYKLDPRFKQSRVNIDSFYGNVLLTGQVPDMALKQLAEDNLRAMSDVKAVHNYLSVEPQIAYGTIMQDLAATADAKARLLRASIVRESKVKMHTENGVLYVMGRLNTSELDDLKSTLQQVSNVVKMTLLVDNLDQLSAPNSAILPTPTAIEPVQTTMPTSQPGLNDAITPLPVIAPNDTMPPSASELVIPLPNHLADPSTANP